MLIGRRFLECRERDTNIYICKVPETRSVLSSLAAAPMKKLHRALRIDRDFEKAEGTTLRPRRLLFLAHAWSCCELKYPGNDLRLVDINVAFTFVPFSFHPYPRKEVSELPSAASL